MPFIGQEPITGAFHKLDAITTSSTNTYNLLLNGGAYSPASANHLMVSLNGVIQSPGDSFTVSGSQITFVPSSGTLSSSDSIDFIMAYGDVLNIGTPSDGSVNTNQLANSAVIDAKVASGISASKLTGALPALDGSALTGISSLNAPKHYAFRQLDSQYFTSSTTRLAFWSIGENFSSGITIDETNERFIPTVAGKYLFMYSIYCSHSGGTFTLSSFLRKNGGNKFPNAHLINYNGGFNQTLTGQAVLDMNGTTDYVDVAANHNGGGNATCGTHSFLFGMHINAS